MEDQALVLACTRDAQNLKVSCYLRNEDGETTIRPYELYEVPWEQVEKTCGEIRNLFVRSNRAAQPSPDLADRLKKSGQLLFDFLIPPKARATLADISTCALTLHLDDRLVHLPWELLHDGREFLCRRFAMGRIVSTRQPLSSLSKRSVNHPLRLLILADPCGNLQASYREGIDIKNFLDGKRHVFEVDFKSDPLDKEFVRKNLRDYDLVHYAGHADYHPEHPAKSGWRLADGTFSASELSSMAGLQAMPSLVFANGCQSGQTTEWQTHEGVEQQVFGLANAYLLSGVQHYIGTFSDVLDEPSCLFAQSFYGSLAEGENVGESVRKARQKLIQTYGDQTIAWASYMLYGDPSFAFGAEAVERVPRGRVRERSGAEWSVVTRGETVLPQAGRQETNQGRRFSLGSGLNRLAPRKHGKQILHSVQDDIIQHVASSDTVFRGGGYARRRRGVYGYSIAGIVIIALALFGGRYYAQDRDTKLAGFERAVEDPVAVKPAVYAVSAGEQASVMGSQQVSAGISGGSAEAAVAAPLTLSMNIIGQRREADGSYTEVIVSEGSVLRSYDNFQIHLETSRQAHVYVLIYDSEGKASQLFPDPKIEQPGFIQEGQRIAVPAHDLWFWLDENTGTETIYVLAAEKPLSGIQALLRKMEAADEPGKKSLSHEIKENIKLVQRGIGGIGKGKAVTYPLSDGKKIQKVTEVVSGTGSVVRAISFHHR